MHPSLKKLLRSLSLDLRHTLEGVYDAQGVFHPGDLERRLNELGVWRQRPARPLEELPHLAPEDKAARQVIDAYIAYRLEAGVARPEAVAEFVREAAYTWANRLFALRCLEARSIIDEVILQKEAYGGRSLAHQRLARRDPAACAGADEGLFAVLFAEFAARAAELPELFNPHAPAVALRPSLPAIKRCIALLSAEDEVFAAPDALGWAYQYWNSEEKERVFEKVRTHKAKIAGADIIPATQLYTEPYMVKFLVQNSLGALWMGMHPDSKLAQGWEYYVKDADRAPVEPKPVSEITLLDPALGSGHFHLEAFDLFFQMYQEEFTGYSGDKGYSGWIESNHPEYPSNPEHPVKKSPEQIAASILNNNLYGIDIDGRAIQIAAAALWMKAKETAPDLQAGDLTTFHQHIVAADIRLPQGVDHLKAFLEKHPEAAALRPALETIFDGLQNAHELGSLVQIEEPVEKELRYLKEQYDAARGRPEQLALFAEMRRPRQGELPLGVESYAHWKAQTLAQLEAHFAEEAQTADPAQAFFGQSAYKGLALFDLLARRYSVVTANPPWMGSKNMGDVLARYLAKHYPNAKRDIYASFIVKCCDLAKRNGYIAMITQQSWLFLSSYTELRRTSQTDFDGLLNKTNIECLAHLGRYAFSELGNAVIQPVLFILRNIYLIDKHRIYAIRLNSPRESDEQSCLLQQCAKKQVEDLVSVKKQASFLDIPNSPIVYWAISDFLNLLQSENRFDTIADVKSGIVTGNNDRHLRFHWEANGGVVNEPYAKGGGYSRWCGFEYLTINWNRSQPSISETKVGRTKDDTYFGKQGWTYALISRGSLSVRLLSAASKYDNISLAIFPNNPDYLYRIGALLMGRATSYLLRCLSPSLSFNAYYVRALPIPSKAIPVQLEIIGEWGVKLKTSLKGLDLNEAFFRNSYRQAPTLFLSLELIEIDFACISAILHTIEAMGEEITNEYFNLSSDAVEKMNCEMGIPSGLYPLICEYDRLPQFDIFEVELENWLVNFVNIREHFDLSSSALSIIRNRLRHLFELGPGFQENFEIDAESDEESLDISIHSPIPSDTFLEELSQKLQTHPISVYWLLKEGIEQEGWRCPPEEKRLAEDRFSVLVLRLLGHRWPKQIEAGEPLPDWADADGILPLTPAFGELTLLERVRARLGEEFLTTDNTDYTEKEKSVTSVKSVVSLEREFEEIVGEPLEKWLSGSFYKRHVSQFKKRPIAWQLTSAPAQGKKKKGLSKAPAFACLVYYHRLDADLLPKLRSQYLGPLRQRYETELRTLNGIALASAALTADQSERRVQLEAWIDELHDFEARLERVAAGGFAGPGLEALLAPEPLDVWTSRDGHTAPPETATAFLLQEQRYDPDLNDGVRVNIAPLQKAGLLAADVLDAKDLDKAIADRAAWRADERRWCREGKLPKPGWWEG